MGRFVSVTGPDHQSQRAWELQSIDNTVQMLQAHPGLECVWGGGGGGLAGR